MRRCTGCWRRCGWSWPTARATRARGDADHEAASAAGQPQLRRSLPGIRQLLDSDVLAAYHGDPAARSVDEVLLCYPGVLAMIHHRLAHQLYRLGLPLLARIVAELAHGQTGIDIHPGAQIGGFLHRPRHGGRDRRDRCDRPTRAAVPGRHAGRQALSDRSEGNLQKGLPRHPVVEDDVVIYAGATILGRVTWAKAR
jgi:serine O-acetyltransferase